MEVDGVIEMFKRSVEELGVKYKKYIGDSDLKPFKNIIEAYVYNGNSIVQKNECVLHVKKRMYRRVKEAKKTLTQLQKAKKQIEAAGEKKLENKRTCKEEKAVTLEKKRTSKKNAVDSEGTKVKCLPLINKLLIKLSTYYGLAIMRNENSVKEMKKAAWETYYHLVSSDEEPSILIARRVLIPGANTKN